MIRFKYLSCIFFITALALASDLNDFTVPKNQIKPNQSLKTGKKIKEQIVDEIIKIISKSLVSLDYISIKSRVYLIDQLELALCGESGTLINSSSKSERQAYLDLVEALNQELIQTSKKVEDLIKQIKELNLKAGKLKG